MVLPVQHRTPGCPDSASFVLLRQLSCGERGEVPASPDNPWKSSLRLPRAGPHYTPVVCPVSRLPSEHAGTCSLVSVLSSLYHSSVPHVTHRCTISRGEGRNVGVCKRVFLVVACSLWNSLTLELRLGPLLTSMLPILFSCSSKLVSFNLLSSPHIFRELSNFFLLM